MEWSQWGGGRGGGGGPGSEGNGGLLFEYIWLFKYTIDSAELTYFALSLKKHAKYFLKMIYFEVKHILVWMTKKL